MSDAHTDSKVTPRRNRPALSIRVRLILLAILAIAPLMLERVHGLEKARAIRIERANADVIDLARRGVEAQRQIIDSVRAMVQVVARVYARVGLDQPDCNQYVADLTTKIPWIRDISIAGTDGRIKCSTEPLAVGLNVGERQHFKNALASREFALSDYMINRLNQVPSVVATYPIMTDDGTVKGVVLAVINLRWIGEFAAIAAQKSGASVMLFDGNGTLIAGSNDQQAFVGKRLADHALTREIMAKDEGRLTAPGL